MVSDHLADWLSNWHDVRELVRVSAEVDPIHEIAAITDRITSGQGGPAILFDHVRGHTVPVVTNLLGSPRRLSAAFGIASLEGLSNRINDWLMTPLPRGVLDAWKLLPRLAELAKWPPVLVKTGLCQQVVRLGRDVNLAELPALTMWPGDPAPAITWGQLHSTSPKAEATESEPRDQARRSVSVVPIEVRGHDRLLVHCDENSSLRELLNAYGARTQQMPVAVVLGGDPITSVASWAPLPRQADSLVFAGFLRNRPVELVTARSVPLAVPASAEIVIEGFIDPQADFESAEPISRETGFFGSSESSPFMRVTAITHRANPVFPAMVPGPAPSESHWLDRACERLLLPLAQLWIPELVDWQLPFSGACRHILFASIRKTYAQQARKVMHALWALPRIATSKMLVVVDDDFDLQDDQAVWARVAAHVDPSRDLVLWDGPADPLDHATAIRGAGRKLGIDATRKLPRESGSSWAARPLQWTPEIAQRLQQRWPEFGL